MKRFLTLLLQGRLGRLYIYLVEKHLGTDVEHTYTRYLTQTTQSNLIGIDTGPHFNKITIEYPLETDSYSDKIKSYN
jgi:hypothetical protein